jgi:hypothetical protein
LIFLVNFHFFFFFVTPIAFEKREPIGFFGPLSLDRLGFSVPYPEKRQSAKPLRAQIMRQFSEARSVFAQQLNDSETETDRDGER